MKISINAAIQMANEVLKGQTFFLMTKAINQDRLEQTVSVLRQRRGYNKNPFIAEVNHIIAKIMSANLIQATSSGNCESSTQLVLEDNFLSSDSLIEYENEEVEAESCPDSNEMAVEKCIMHDICIEEPSMDALPSMRYFAGYVAHKILPKLKYEKCLRDIRKPEEILTTPTELFLFYKNYSKKTDFGSLWAPSDPFFAVCKKHMSIFSVMFKEQPEEIDILKSIVEKCCAATPEWFSKEYSEHRQQLLSFLILVLLLKHCLWTVEKTRWTK